MMLRPSQKHATSCNIVARTVLHTFGHPVATCCKMLDLVWKCCKTLHTFGQLLYNILQRHPTILQDVEMLRAFGRAFKSKFLYLCVTVCVHLLPQKFSAHWHFESNITGYRYKRSLWIGVFVVKSYHELLLSIMEFDKLINNCDHCVLYFCFFVCFLIAIFAIVFFSSSSSLWTSSWIVTVTSQTKQ